ncbi:MAG: hypothetical protein JWP33_743 [Blastococcus sp.]|nr:hypothetical protein [Blastococcus sp.]
MPRSAVVVLLAVLLALTGCEVEWQIGAGPPEPAASVGQSSVPAGTLDPAGASAALAGLPVAGKTSLDGYERGCGADEGCVFGPAWADVDRNGCDQRNDVLRRDLAGIEVREGTQDCVVVAGVLDDPYTGEIVPFAKADAGLVPIDHVVPLAAAWVQGAAAWPAEQRQAFANDLNNLMATTRSENSAKGDSTADEWVPSDPEYGCSYATVVITVKDRYALAVSPAEEKALESLLATC